MTAIVQPPTSSRRIEQIEAMRAFAIIFVVLHHLNGVLVQFQGTALQHIYHRIGGWTGVDLFFAISGFVIARDLVPRLDSAGSRSSRWRIIVSFWLRRIWRLIPSAWLWLALILLASWQFNSSGVFGSVRTNLEATVYGVLNIANFRFADAFGNYFYGGSFVYWSLSLEEQFYLLFPLLLYWTRPMIAALLIAVILGQFFLERSVMLLSFRTDAIAWGVLLALWSRGQSWARLAERVRRCSATSLRIVTTSLMITLLWLGSPQATVFAASHGISVRIGLIALVSAILVGLAAMRAEPESSGLVRRCLVWIGHRSYAIYLIHVPVFLGLREIHARMAGSSEPIGEHKILFILAALVLILAMASLNYRLVEQPLRLRGARVAQRFLLNAHEHGNDR